MWLIVGQLPIKAEQKVKSNEQKVKSKEQRAKSLALLKSIHEIYRF